MFIPTPSLCGWSRCRGRLLGAPLVLLCLPLQAGCGPELTPISRVETLRVIGIQKDKPFGQPGETVELSLLYEDTRANSAPVETFFAFWCINPPGGSFAECLTTSPPEGFEPTFIRNQTNFSVTIPEDILRPASMDPRLPDSGMAVIFSGVCAGRLSSALLEEEDLETGVSGQELMPRCLDENGDDVSPDDFLVSYSTILVYEELRNANPIIEGFMIDGQQVEVDCIDRECDAPFELPEITGCEDGVACIDACEADGEIEICPVIEISVMVDSASAEVDEVAKIAYDRELEESIWASYFVDRGSISAPVTLVNDADLGWQEKYSTNFYAPKEIGPMRIWAAVRDNRGGVAWVRIPAFVK
jgi:hypothetical protein